MSILIEAAKAEVIGSLGCSRCHGDRVIATALGDACVPMGAVDVIGREPNGFLRLACGHTAHESAALVLREGQWLKLSDGTILQGKGVIPIHDRDDLRCRTRGGE